MPFPPQRLLPLLLLLWCGTGPLRRVGGQPLCAAGSYSTSATTSQCTLCAAGTYATGIGATKCSATPPPIREYLRPTTVTASPTAFYCGATNDLQTVCKGTYGALGGCVSGCNDATKAVDNTTATMWSTFNAGFNQVHNMDFYFDTPVAAQLFSAFVYPGDPGHSREFWTIRVADAIGGPYTTIKQFTVPLSFTSAGQTMDFMSAVPVPQRRRVWSFTTEARAWQLFLQEAYFSAVFCPQGFYMLNVSACAPCTVCLAGSYGSQACAATTNTVCAPCLTSTYTTGSGAATCLDCTAGTYTIGTGATAAAACIPPPCAGGGTGCVQCAVGQYSDTSTGACRVCVGNSYCAEAGACINACLPCPQLTTSDANHSTCLSAVCSVCPVGFWCGGTFELSACPAGTFSALKGQSMSSACRDCAAGTFAAAPNASACLACAAGTYAHALGSTACAQCPLGAYQPQPNASSCMQCSRGTYGIRTGTTSISGGCAGCVRGKYGTGSGFSAGSACDVCGTGTYATGVGLTAAAVACTNCTAGSYSTGQGMIALDNCTLCAPGSYQPLPARYQCVQCPAHTYLNRSGGSRAADCLPCPSGSQTLIPNGAPSLQSCVCALGNFGRPGGPCTLCPPGAYGPVTNASACALCPINTYAAELDPWVVRISVNAVCTEVPLNGSTLGAGSTTYLCNMGYYIDSPASLDACSACPLHTYFVAANATACAACTQGLTSATASPSAASCVCKAGYYAPAVRRLGAECVLCEPGAYCVGGGAPSQPCPPNSTTMAGVSGASKALQCMCVPGFYRQAVGHAACQPCGSGFVCTGGEANRTACPGNTTTGATTLASLLQQCFCLPGYRSPVPNTPTGVSCVLCPAGQLCLSGNASSCPPNSIAPAGSSNASACQCNAGYYYILNTGCVGCPINTYCTGTAGGPLVPCPGNSSTGGMTLSTGPSFCACNAGFFGAVTSALSTCRPCPPGSHCAYGVTAPTACVSNAHAPAMSSSGTACVCNAGYFGSNSQVCALCYAGTYMASKNFTGTACTACAVGTYSATQAATSSAVCVACPAGRYSSAAPAPSVAACLLCASGTSSSAMGATSASVCALCSAGTYSSGLGATAASAACVACGAGAYSSAPGATLFSACAPCAAGTYGTRAGLSASGHCLQCQAGAYSATSGATSAAACVLCAGGRYSSAQGAAVATACAACGSGSYSSAVGANSSGTCALCVAGYYATAVGATQAQACLACASGTYGTGQGAAASGACVRCSGGTYGGTIAAATSALACIACGAGTFSTALGAVAQATCTNCSVGRFSSVVGAAASTACVACRGGTYNPSVGGSGAQACVLCNAGTFSSAGGATSLSTCAMCQSGVAWSRMGATTCETCSAGTRLVAGGAAA